MWFKGTKHILRKFKQKLVGVGATLGTLWTLILKFGDKLF